jgi:hypothetical protein
MAAASPMGPVKPMMGRFSLEFELGAAKREMERQSAKSEEIEAEPLLFLGRISYGLTDQVEITMRIGGQDLDADFRPAAGTYNGSSQFAWGAGISGILHDAGAWNVAGVANYFTSRGHTGPINLSGAITRNNVADYSDWNIGLQIQGKYDQFLPYLGLRYSNARVEYDRWDNQPETYRDYRADQNVGLYVGAGFDLSPQWSGYVEGRFIDEIGFGGGIRYTF